VIPPVFVHLCQQLLLEFLIPKKPPPFNETRRVLLLQVCVGFTHKGVTLTHATTINVVSTSTRVVASPGISDAENSIASQKSNN